MYRDAAKSIADELYQLGQKLGKDGVLGRSDMYKQHRLERLRESINRKIMELGEKAESQTAQNMQKGYEACYQETRSQLEESDFAMPNKKAMEEMLDRPWRGGNFSGRLWKNTEKLAEVLNDSLLHGIQQGKTTTELASELANVMQAGFNAAHRLVRTETIHYLNCAALQGYKDSGVRQVQYWAAIDERTCETCGNGGYHGKIFDIDKAPVLPLHPNCRCTYLPVVEDEAVRNPEMLKVEGDPSKEIKQAFEREIALIPKPHRDIIESEVKRVIVDSGGNSRYDRSQGILYLARELQEGEIIHELAHVLETRLGIYYDKAFVEILQSGFEEFSWNDLEYVPGEYGKPVIFVRNPKLVNEYQGRLYDEVGFWDDNGNMNPFSLGDYFAEGYREYIFHAENLRKHDEKLYDFIREMENAI